MCALWQTNFRAESLYPSKSGFRCKIRHYFSIPQPTKDSIFVKNNFLYFCILDSYCYLCGLENLMTQSRIMSSCTVESWTLKELAAALQDMLKDKRRIAVPIFQRGKRWKPQQQKVFIDSLIKGFPVGTMLFHEEKDEEGKRTYILIDGLQRGNCIKKYMNNPTEFFYDSSISNAFCQTLLKEVNADQEQNYHQVRALLSKFIKEQKTFKNLQYYEPAKDIAEMFEASPSIIGNLIKIIGKFFEERQDLYDKISSTVIPVIIYHGEEENLPAIFDRINSQGTPLDQYEVYAASWPVNRRFKTSNIDIVECAIKKYDAFVNDGFVIQGYDREKMRSSKEVNAFEYLFGLGKYLTSKYDILAFQKDLPDDTVNTLSFELVNACLNDTDRIKILYKNIYELKDVDTFEKALCSSIDYVADAVSPIMRFKGNNRSKKSKILHSKFQILSMISTSFKEMYLNGDYSHIDESWEEKKNMIANNLRLYYVYDILTDFWSEGGNAKIHAIAKPNRYTMQISPRAWRTALDGFYDKSMFRSECKNIQHPKSEEYVFLNCIYLNTFTAMDQLSIDKFDVEHIAPKEQMKRFIKKTKGAGLPISCIANLCYLPDYVNRSKRDRNFYQDKKYLNLINLEEVENKFSFTTEDDLEWMDLPYETPEDFEILKDYYTEYCNNRFDKMKQLFCKSMGIDYEAMQNVNQEETTPIGDSSDISNTRTSKYLKGNITRVEQHIGDKLVNAKRQVYVSEDGKKGFIFLESKAYKQGDRQKYWYGYRVTPLKYIEDCEEKYIVLGCRDSDVVLMMPIALIESQKDYLNNSKEDGIIRHYHLVIFRDNSGHVTELLSKPNIQEIDIDKYKI